MIFKFKFKYDPDHIPRYFLISVILLYLVLGFFDKSKTLKALTFFWHILLKVIPIFILIYVLMLLTNYFVKPKTLVRILGKEAGFKGWIVAIISGILSSGPIYMWYPLLSDLQKHGVKNSYIACFLYNRAVKIPLLPLLIGYFGLKYVVILTGVMVVMSVIQGYVTEKLMEVF